MIERAVQSWREVGSRGRKAQRICALPAALNSVFRAIVTFRPSSASVTGIWHDRREFVAVIAESSRSFSSSLIGGSLSAKAGSTWTWQVAHEQQPPHSASSSSKPLSRIASITVRPRSASTVLSSPARLTTISLGMGSSIPVLAPCIGALAAAARQLRGIWQAGRADMGLTAEQLQAQASMRWPARAGDCPALARAGYPEPRIRERGYRTLLRTIVGQQVSVAAASFDVAQAGGAAGRGR
jgi:hypothetical protein